MRIIMGRLKVNLAPLTADGRHELRKYENGANPFHNDMILILIYSVRPLDDLQV